MLLLMMLQMLMLTSHTPAFSLLPSPFSLLPSRLSTGCGILIYSVLIDYYHDTKFALSTIFLFHFPSVA